MYPAGLFDLDVEKCREVIVINQIHPASVNVRGRTGRKISLANRLTAEKITLWKVEWYEP